MPSSATWKAINQHRPPTVTNELHCALRFPAARGRCIISDNYMIDDKALLKDYLSEAEELLDSLLADLDSLASSRGAADINLINRAFRTVHSLKGLSGMMGLAEVQSLAHDFEDILDDLR